MPESWPQRTWAKFANRQSLLGDENRLSVPPACQEVRLSSKAVGQTAHAVYAPTCPPRGRIPSVLSLCLTRCKLRGKSGIHLPFGCPAQRLPLLVSLMGHASRLAGDDTHFLWENAPAMHQAWQQAEK